MTESIMLEQAADPLDEVISSLAAVVTRLRDAAGAPPSRWRSTTAPLPCGHSPIP
jgi:hypothetical protein